MKKQDRYKRPLSPFERMWIGSHQSPLSIVFEGSGDLDPDLWKQAVEGASEQNPGCRVVLKGRYPFGHYWHEADVHPPVRLIHRSGWNGHDTENMDFLLDHLNVFTGPVCEVLLVPGDPARVVFRAHHAVMDGRAIYYFAREVFRQLDGREPEGHCSVMTDLELARKIGGRKRTITEKCVLPVRPGVPGKPGIVFSRVTIKGKVNKLLPRMLMALSVRSWSLEAGPVLFDVPVDMRQYAPEVASTANLTGSLRIQVWPGDSLEKVAGYIDNQVRDRRCVDAVVSSAYIKYVPISVISMAAARMRKEGRVRGIFTPSAVVSNFGRLDRDDFRSGHFNIQSYFVVPASIEASSLIMAVTGTEGAVELTAKIPFLMGSGGRLRELLEFVADEITQ